MRKINLIIVALFMALGAGLTVNSQTNYAQPINNTVKAIPEYVSVNALDIVGNPSRYLQKPVKIRAKFDKYSTLGLDYKPALRSSEKFITFLIQRPDVKSHDIPLSELKIFLKKDVAEKNIDLDSGDEIEFCGRVFSAALGDAWMDVDSFKVITKKNSAKSEEKSFDY